MNDIPSEMAHAHLEPGETCPTCERRMPHPKKESSPKSKPKALRIPLPDLEAFERNEQACLEHAGLEKSPFALFKLYTLAHALILQSSEMKDFGRRAA